MSEPEYDPETCATAGELRAAGYPIPENVPDCGWIRRSAIRLGPNSGVSVKGSRINVSLPVTFTEPFRWVAVEIEQPFKAIGLR